MFYTIAEFGISSILLSSQASHALLLGKKSGTMCHLIMLNVLAFLGMVWNYKAKCQQAKSWIIKRSCKTSTRARLFNHKKSCSWKNVAFESETLGERTAKRRLCLVQIFINTNRRTRYCWDIEDFSTVRMAMWQRGSQSYSETSLDNPQRDTAFIENNPGKDC